LELKVERIFFTFKLSWITSGGCKWHGWLWRDKFSTLSYVVLLKKVKKRI